MISFNKIVNKLCKRCWNIVFLTDIFEIIDPEYKDKNRTTLNNTIYRLKSEWVIIALKNWVYIVPDSEDKTLNSVDLLDKYYLQLLKKYIKAEVGSHYYISGKKSLEFHMRDYAIGEKIFIINRNLNKKIKVWAYKIIFKTISGNEHGKKINLYAHLSHYTKEILIDTIAFKVSVLELALLEASLIWESYWGVEISLITKALKKYSSILNPDIFKDIAKYKYIMSFNRLKELSKSSLPDLYKLFLDIIKTNGNLFIG